MDEVALHFDVFSDRRYDEKLEVEYVIRLRGVFDEFVCPQTGTTLLCTFAELGSGIQRFWALAQEMKSHDHEIHRTLLNLPFLFMAVLMRITEVEYTSEAHEKTGTDYYLLESFLKVYSDMYSHASRFKKRQGNDFAVVYNTCLIYLRYLIEVMGMERLVRRHKVLELKVSANVVSAPYRDTDLKALSQTLNYFRSNILPKYTHGQPRYKLYFRIKKLEIMLPSFELQCRIAASLNRMSVYFVSYSVIIFVLVAAINYEYKV